MPLAGFGFWGPRLRNLGFFGLLAFLFGIDREQHEMVKTVAPEIAVLAEVEVKLRVLGQPELGFALGESDGSILHCLMLAKQLNFLYWSHQIRLQSNDLERVRRDPGSSFQ